MAIKQLLLKHHNGKFSADIDISIDEWKTMLKDRNIFFPKALDMIHKWYLQPDHQASNIEIMEKYKDEYIKLKATPFNAIVKGLGIRIIKHLNRFEIIDPESKNVSSSYFIIPFEGWHKDGKRSNPFIWKIRKELVQAIVELELFVNNESDCDSIERDFESVVHILGKSEGKLIYYYTTRYERNEENRKNAIKIHGLSCFVCDFNFETIYGELGKHFIEVHHIIPLSSRDEEISVNPITDLICLCSNCHRMIHRKQGDIITPEQLRSILQFRKASLD